MSIIRIYSDESSLQERYFLLGAVWMEENDVINCIKNLRARNAPRCAAEFKWQKVSQNYLAIYQDLVDIFFDALKSGKLRYACLFLDTQNKEVRKYGNYRNEGYFKLYYQLFFQNSQKSGFYRIRPDDISKINPSLDFEELRRCLEHALRKKFGAGVDVGNIAPMNSKASNMIQLVDVVNGTLACFLNDHFVKKDASPAKTALMRYFLARAERDGYIKVIDDNTVEGKRSDVFNLWPFKPRPYKKS